MIASMLRLNRYDIKALRLIDEYSLHRIVYNLFEDVRNQAEKKTSKASGILYTEKGGDRHYKRILMLSNRQPKIPEYGEIESRTINDNYLTYDTYGFEVVINPTKRDKKSGRIIAIRGQKDVGQWFVKKAPLSWGFIVPHENLQVTRLGVKQFNKQGHKVTQGYAILKGILEVKDRQKFIQSFTLGIGRGRAFGCGLLQITPLISSLNF